MKKLLFIGVMIGASSVAGANTPLAIQYGNPVPIDKAVITTTPYHAQENLISQYSLAFGYAGSKIGSDSFWVPNHSMGCLLMVNINPIQRPAYGPNINFKVQILITIKLQWG